MTIRYRKISPNFFFGDLQVHRTVLTVLVFTSKMESPKISKDIIVEVPWGYITGKAWGDERNPIVLCFHGVLDNAGSFYRLIPYLPDELYYIALDLPGHGFSSYFPAHLPSFSISYLPVYKIIVDFFKRDKYIIIGHSYGGQLGYIFTQLYPQYVEKLIMLDTVAMFPIQTEHFKEYVVDRIDSFLDLEKKLFTNAPPTYTYEEALEKLITGRRYGVITTEAAKALLSRGIKSSEDGSGKFVFTVDQRNKYFWNPLRDFNNILETIKAAPVLCPVLIILGKESSFQKRYFKSVITVLKQFRNVTFVDVDGNHDVHNEYPERVAPHIVGFITNKKSKL